MARGSSGLRTAVKIVKAIDKAQKQAARQGEQDRKRRQRELLARERELERELKAAERASITERNSLRKAAKEYEKNLYEIRAQERADLRADFVRSEIN